MPLIAPRNDSQSSPRQQQKSRPRWAAGLFSMPENCASQRTECLDLYSLGVVPTYFLNTFEK